MLTIVAAPIEYCLYHEDMKERCYFDDRIQVLSFHMKTAGHSSDIDMQKELLDHMEMNDKKKRYSHSHNVAYSSPLYY